MLTGSQLTALCISPGLAIFPVDLIRSAAAFLGVGIANTLITFVVYEVLLIFVPYILSICITFFVSLVFVVLCNVRLVFSSRLECNRVARYALYYALYFGIYLAALTFCVEVIDLKSEVAPIFVLIVITPVHFVCSKYIITRAYSS